ncbi:NAD-dependent epimerase/dehydratase family protein [Actinoallomurus iriomotensis]|uniref:UDP-glucose 4-epimerase n=1 Tax=Actinoallomurus iriomotensis TaxID=478107 RepID=A0A9W6VU24_9ACTN|nr:NAD-dependent epimerase/dehydratase family protein [Actinoallomurus iriomotensis]GLY85118.1 UDP-glucose 4-epimerase [Actinoallomurus iriomotensis]
MVDTGFTSNTDSGGATPAAVIGATGFIGTWLTAALTRAGVPTSGYSRAEPFSRDGRAAAGLAGARTVFFVAQTATIAQAEREPWRARADLETFRLLLDVVRRDGDRPTMVLAGSGGAVYGTAVEPPHAETSPVHPATVYGRVKLEMEREMLSAADAVEPVALRIATVYGPGQRRAGGQGVINHWLTAVARGEPLRIYGDPGATRDFVHVEDVVRAMVRVHEMTADGGRVRTPVLNIGCGRPVSLAEVVEVVRKVVTGRSVTVTRLPGREVDRRHSWLDVRNAADVLGWRPRITLEEGMRTMWRQIAR